LKKQSQFAPAQNSTKSYMKGDYDNKPARGAEENKASQSQSISVECSAFSVLSHGFVIPVKTGIQSC
jgi:hypothetical protein